MNISLTNELEEFVHEKVKTGMYLSASEVIREALRVLQERDKLRELKFKQLQDEILSALAQLDKGESEIFDSAKIRAEGRKLRHGRRGDGANEASQNIQTSKTRSA